MGDLQEETLRIGVGARSIHAHLFHPTGAGRSPGILFLMEVYGVRPWVLADARDLAAEGYAVLVPDLYSEMGGLRFCLRQFFNAAGRTNANETEQEALREVFAILEHLKTLPAVDAERIGALGQCLSGGFALHLARRPDVKAPVVYHHSLGITAAGIKSGGRGRNSAGRPRALCPARSVLSSHSASTPAPVIGRSLRLSSPSWLWAWPAQSSSPYGGGTADLATDQGLLCGSVKRETARRSGLTTQRAVERSPRLYLELRRRPIALLG